MTVNSEAQYSQLLNCVVQLRGSVNKRTPYSLQIELCGRLYLAQEIKCIDGSGARFSGESNLRKVKLNHFISSLSFFSHECNDGAAPDSNAPVAR